MCLAVMSPSLTVYLTFGRKGIKGIQSRDKQLQQLCLIFRLHMYSDLAMQDDLFDGKSDVWGRKEGYYRVVYPPLNAMTVNGL